MARLVPGRLSSRLVLTILLASFLSFFAALSTFALFGGSSAVDSPRAVIGWAAIVSGLIAVAVQTAAGVLIARAITRPISTLTDFMAQEATAALEGRTHELPPYDAMLPTEFVTLLSVFEQMLANLSARQAQLVEANEQTLAAKHSLDIAFTDSLEGKLLVHDGIIVLMNPACAAHLGVSAEESVGMSSDVVLADATIRDDHGTNLDVTQLRERLPESIVVQYSIGDRTPRWLEVHSVPHEDRDTTLITTRDITEERRIENLRNEIVSLVSHDLRAPLTVISGYLDLLRRDLDPKSRAKAVSSAAQSADRMQALLEDLLSATRAEEMFSPTSLEPISMSDLADEVVSSFGHTSHHIMRLHTDGPGTVLGEEKRLRQVLVNLISNAIKYSPEGTTIHVGVVRSDGQVITSVEDEGPGVPEADRDVVFERYTRLSENGERRPGIGLGLYIVKAIIESHGGTVRVEARTDGDGAKFVVSLPPA